MDLYIYNSQLEHIGIIDVCESLIWVRRYSAAGTFELYLPDNGLGYIARGNYIYRPDCGEIMYISAVETTQDRHIIVTGYSAEGILRKRALREDVKGGVNAVLSRVLAAAPIPMLELSAENDIAGNYDGDPAASLEDYVRFMIGDSGLSYRIDFDRGRGKLVFKIYGGIDRSTDVIFAETLGNMYNVRYSAAEDVCYNVIVCTCTVPDDDVEIYGGLPRYTYNDNIVGLERNELRLIVDPVIKLGLRVVDEKVIEYKYVDNGDTLKIMQAQAAAIASNVSENFTAEVMADGYRTEYNVGDLVSIINGIGGAVYVRRVEEVKEVFDGEGHTVTPVFGDNLKTIYDLIKMR